MKKKRYFEKLGYDFETIKQWKHASLKAKLEWMDSALRFGKSKKK